MISVKIKYNSRFKYLNQFEFRTNNYPTELREWASRKLGSIEEEQNLNKRELL